VFSVKRPDFNIEGAHPTAVELVNAAAGMRRQVKVAKWLLYPAIAVGFALDSYALCPLWFSLISYLGATQLMGIEKLVGLMVISMAFVIVGLTLVLGPWVLAVTFCEKARSSLLDFEPIHPSDAKKALDFLDLYPAVALYRKRVVTGRSLVRGDLRAMVEYARSCSEKAELDAIAAKEARVLKLQNDDLQRLNRFDLEVSE